MNNDLRKDMFNLSNDEYYMPKQGGVVLFSIKIFVVFRSMLLCMLHKLALCFNGIVALQYAHAELVKLNCILLLHTGFDGSDATVVEWVLICPRVDSTQLCLYAF